MKMNRFLIETHSFAAPFLSDVSTRLIAAKTPLDALEECARTYKHPCGLYSAGCWQNAEAYHDGAAPIARWLSNHARTIMNSKGTMFCSNGVGQVEIDGKTVLIENPRAGSAEAC